MQLRRARPSDLPALMALVRRVVPLMQAAGNAQWDADYPNEGTFTRDIELGQLWVADAGGGGLAGVAAITTDQEPEYAQVGWDIREAAIVVHRLAVDPAHRGAGVAVALMEQAEAVARERGIEVLRVDTNTQNPATQRLFPRLGYSLAGEIGLSFRPGLRFLCYEKRLGPREEGAEAAPMHSAAIGLGSNLASPFGPPEATLREAVIRMGRLGRVRAVSSFHSTAPVGYTEQPRFLNAALLLETQLAPSELMSALLSAEREFGRDRATSPPKGPRTLDLDLLLYDSLVVHQAASAEAPALTLPHPEMTQRRFVLAPLAEIAPERTHPVTGLTVLQLLTALSAE